MSLSQRRAILEMQRKKEASDHPNSVSCYYCNKRSDEMEGILVVGYHIWVCSEAHRQHFEKWHPLEEVNNVKNKDLKNDKSPPP